MVKWSIYIVTHGGIRVQLSSKSQWWIVNSVPWNPYSTRVRNKSQREIQFPIHMQTHHRSPTTVPPHAIRNNSVVRLYHCSTGHFLRSHPNVQAKTSMSKQQMVFASEGQHDDGLWIIRGEKEFFAKGDIVRFMHLLSQRNLHSHLISTFNSKQQEVTCFGEKGLGDDNDYWMIHLDQGGFYLQEGSPFELEHVATKQFFHSHLIQLQKDVPEYEVTCFNGRDANNMWLIPKTLTFIANSSVIRMRHLATGKFLSSNFSSYTCSQSSKQQIVFCNDSKNREDLWILRGDHDFFFTGSIARLTHLKTHRNLHSHSIKSPITKQQEVSCFGEKGVGDQNDFWMLDLVQSQSLWVGTIFRLKHVITGLYLHSHTNQLDNTSKNQEVTCFDGEDENNYWQIVEKL